MPREKAKAGFAKRRVEDQANGHTRIDWREELQRYLIAGGTTGQKQGAVQRRLIAHARSEQINDELDALLMEGKIQKFLVPTAGKGKPAIVWRATTKILERSK